MKLTFLDRMMILNLLPETGTFKTLKILRVLRESLVPTEVESVELNVQEDAESGQITWNPEKDVGKEIKIGEIAFDLIQEKLKDMDEKEELTANHENIYKIFVD